MNDQIRWVQRLNSFGDALGKLQAATRLAHQRELSELEQQGLIQAFEFTHELAWNVMKDFFLYQGNSNISGSRDATREAFKMGLISEGDVWMKMIISRNQTSHTYNRKIADGIAELIIKEYEPMLTAFFKQMHQRIDS